MIVIRPQRRPDDLEAIRAVNSAAFDRHGQTSAFDDFRANRDDVLSLVAMDNDLLVGHVLFSPATLKQADNSVAGMGLGQLAVLPEYQGQGIGTRLAEAGLEQLCAAGIPFVVVVGHATYYPRFGFEPGNQHGMQCQWDGIPDDNFLVAFLDEQQRPALTGTAHFDGL